MPALEHCSPFLHCSGDVHDRTRVTLQNGQSCPPWTPGRGKKVVKPVWELQGLRPVRRGAGTWLFGAELVRLPWSKERGAGMQPWKTFRSHVGMLKVRSGTVQILCKVARRGNDTEKREKIQFLKWVHLALACFAAVVLSSQRCGNPQGTRCRWKKERRSLTTVMQFSPGLFFIGLILSTINIPKERKNVLL